MSVRAARDARSNRREDGVARAISVVVVILAVVGSCTAPPRSGPDGGPGVRELVGLVGLTRDAARSALATRSLTETAGVPGEFAYAAPDGCAGAAGLRLVTVAGRVVGWVRTAPVPGRLCLSAVPLVADASHP